MSTGDIGAVLDTLEFDPVTGRTLGVCHIAGEVYACAYYGPDTDGWLKTFKVDSLGAIPATVEDSWEFDSSEGQECSMVRIGTSFVAIAYMTSAQVGHLKTIGVNAAGAITESIQDTLNMDPHVTQWPQIIHVTGNVYAVVWNAGVGTGYIKTCTISTGGAISATWTDSLSFSIEPASGAKLCHVLGEIYCVTFQGDDTYGHIKTFSINSIGQISDTFISTYQFYVAIGAFNSVVKARSNYFVVAFQGAAGHGFLKVIYISEGGVITDPAVDTYEFDTAVGRQPSLVSMGQGYIALAYCGVDEDGFLKTFKVDASGSLNATTLGSLEFDPAFANHPFLFHVTGNIFGIAYDGPDNDGWLCSTSIEMPPDVYPQHLMTMGIG